MPLVKASNDDDAFLREVASHMMDDCTRMQEHTTAMIEEYLRRKLQVHENQLRDEFDKEKNKLHAARTDVEHKLECKSKELHKMLRIVTRLCNALSASRERSTIKECFHIWRRFVQQRQYHHSTAKLISEHNKHEWLRQSFYWPWRLFATVRRCQRQNREHMQVAQHEMDEMLMKHKDMEKQLVRERQRYTELEQKYKDGFVDGVSALNRTAIHVLHGDQRSSGSDSLHTHTANKNANYTLVNETQNEKDVAAIAAILRRESTAGSHPLQRTAKHKNVFCNENKTKLNSESYQEEPQLEEEQQEKEEECLEYECEYNKEDELNDNEDNTRSKLSFHKVAGEEMDGKFADSGSAVHFSPHTFTAPSKSSHRLAHREDVHNINKKEYEAYAARGICPVHFTDAQGNFYHRCFADHVARDRSQNALYAHSCDARTIAHQPFVVRPNVDHVRSVNTIPDPPKKDGMVRMKKSMHFK